MLKRFFGREKGLPVDTEINVVLEEMHRIGVNSEEYSRLMTLLERLNEVKAKEAQAPVSRDTVAMVLGNLVGILLIVAYEQKHVISSKAFNQINRPR